MEERSLFERIGVVSIEEELKKSYLDYAMSVIIGRALPDVRDGLKPVHRRIIYTQYISGNHYGKPFKKSARIVGDVMGKFHPHGDAAVYDAIVRMAQDFSMRYPLVDGQGNFGSIDGDSPAAMRYTEVRMSKIAHELVKDIEKETVEFVPNYDGEEVEPVVLPAAIPNLLINGSSGIAVGMATNIPPHNLKEVCEGAIALLENPELSVHELMDYIKGPDFPTMGIIVGKEGIINAYQSGKGLLRVRARAHIENIKKDKEAIVITELPYQVNKANLIEKIANLVKEKKIEGITDIRDESNREGIRVVLELQKGEIGEIILKQLYKFTEMETTFGVQLLAIERNQPKLFDLKGLLQAFLAHRKDIIIKRTAYELRKSRERAHILEGLNKALDYLDEVIDLIRKSESPETAKRSLIEKFDFSEVQAKAILDMRLQRLTGLEREKIVNEYKEILMKIKDLEDILSSEERQKAIIIEELNKIKEEYGDERRTEIIEEEKEISLEEMIIDEEMVITATFNGYIKRTKASEYRSQNKGGKGRSGMATREDDFVMELFVAKNKDSLLFFTNKGRVYHLKVYEIPESHTSSKGRALVNLLNLEKDEKVVSFISARDCFDDTHYLVLATKEGMIKRTQMTEFSQIRSNGKFAITFKEGDELVGARISDGKSYIFLATKMGKSIIFDENEVRATGRLSRGVIGIRLKAGDEVVELEVLSGELVDTEDEEGTGKALSLEGEILTVTKKGYGKRTPLNFYRIQGRGGSGIININVTEKNGEVAGGLCVREKDEVMIITGKGQLIRTKVEGISRLNRRTQGFRVISIEENDEVVGVAKIVIED